MSKKLKINPTNFYSTDAFLFASIFDVSAKQYARFSRQNSLFLQRNFLICTKSVTASDFSFLRRGFFAARLKSRPFAGGWASSVNYNLMLADASPNNNTIYLKTRFRSRANSFLFSPARSAKTQKHFGYRHFRRFIALARALEIDNVLLQKIFLFEFLSAVKPAQSRLTQSPAINKEPPVLSTFAVYLDAALVRPLTSLGGVSRFNFRYPYSALLTPLAKRNVTGTSIPVIQRLALVPYLLEARYFYYFFENQVRYQRAIVGSSSSWPSLPPLFNIRLKAGDALSYVHCLYYLAFIDNFALLSFMKFGLTVFKRKTPLSARRIKRFKLSFRGMPDSRLDEEVDEDLPPFLTSMWGLTKKSFTFFGNFLYLTKAYVFLWALPALISPEVEKSTKISLELIALYCRALRDGLLKDTFLWASRGVALFDLARSSYIFHNFNYNNINRPFFLFLLLFRVSLSSVSLVGTQVFKKFLKFSAYPLESVGPLHFRFAIKHYWVKNFFLYCCKRVYFFAITLLKSSFSNFFFIIQSLSTFIKLYLVPFVGKRNFISRISIYFTLFCSCSCFIYLVAKFSYFNVVFIAFAAFLLFTIVVFSFFTRTVFPLEPNLLFFTQVLQSGGGLFLSWLLKFLSERSFFKVFKFFANCFYGIFSFILLIFFNFYVLINSLFVYLTSTLVIFFKIFVLLSDFFYRHVWLIPSNVFRQSTYVLSFFFWSSVYFQNIFNPLRFNFNFFKATLTPFSLFWLYLDAKLLLGGQQGWWFRATRSVLGSTNLIVYYGRLNTLLEYRSWFRLPPTPLSANMRALSTIGAFAVMFLQKRFFFQPLPPKRFNGMNFMFQSHAKFLRPIFAVDYSVRALFSASTFWFIKFAVARSSPVIFWPTSYYLKVFFCSLLLLFYLCSTIALAILRSVILLAYSLFFSL